MPGAEWFPGARLNYAEHVFRARDPANVAVTHASELRPLVETTWGDLHEETRRFAAALRRSGIGPGDRVVGYLPNIVEAVVAFHACASLGATWSSCSPDFGARSVVDRFAQIEPRVLLTVDGYRYGGRDHDRLDAVRALQQAMPSLERTIVLGYLDPEPSLDGPPPGHELGRLRRGGRRRAALVRAGAVRPPAVGALQLRHHGPAQGDRARARRDPARAPEGARPPCRRTGGRPPLLVHDDGLDDVELPERRAADAGIDRAVRRQPGPSGSRDALGSRRAGRRDVLRHLGKLHRRLHEGRGRTAGGTRSLPAPGGRLDRLPLSPEGFDWIYDRLGPDVWLFSTSGGTDLCTAFVGGVPTLPVYRGELQARALGAKVEAWSAEGRAVVGEVGELVITEPMPSMPIRLWGDTNDARYRASYFDTFPGIWRHGDWIEITDRGTAIITGRSDATINRGGIRMGTAEIYRAVLTVDEVVDALVVDLPREGTQGYMPLFVVLRPDVDLDDDLVARIKTRIREDCSPRHVPDEIRAVPAVPRTLSGKVLEVPVKRILSGEPADRALSRDSLADPDALRPFEELAEEWRA